jgi:hypothetical protein
MPLIGACCELGWCEPVEARVWSVGVVVDPPVFDDPASLAEVGEQMLVEALVRQAAVGASPRSYFASAYLARCSAIRCRGPAAKPGWRLR